MGFGVMSVLCPTCGYDQHLKWWQRFILWTSIYVIVECRNCGGEMLVDDGAE